MTKKKELASWDIETDPFLYGREPRPFCNGLAYYENGVKKYADFWGANCLEGFYLYLCGLKNPMVIYAHNGGKFDFVYLLRMGLLEQPVKIINGRIVEARFAGHTLRDSYAIIPVPLAAYQKDAIDYDNFEYDKRDDNKSDILKYLKSDCEYLLEMVTAFWEKFGDNLTIGGTAIKELKRLCPFDRTTESHDEVFRPFYFGGRVQCFETGHIKTDKQLKIFDVNSMYPDVMSNSQHFIGANKKVTKFFESYLDFKTGHLINDSDKPYFCVGCFKNNGALPSRAGDGGLTFDVKEGVFYAASHEIKVGLKYGLLEIIELTELYIPDETINFDEYVSLYMKDKIRGKMTGDKLLELFSKLLLNSAYGKFGQNPRNYFDWIIIDVESDNRPHEYMHYFPEPDFIGARRINAWKLYADYGDVEIWRKPAPADKFFDVSVAASITSAARAVLLEAIHKADRPLYCDTDSILCEDLTGVRLDPTELGAWDLEKTGTHAYIAGKKLYALFNGDECLKKACKGVNLTGDQIKRLSMGESVESHSEAPNFKLTGETEYMQRILGAEKHTKLFNKFGEKYNVRINETNS